MPFTKTISLKYIFHSIKSAYLFRPKLCIPKAPKNTHHWYWTSLLFAYNPYIHSVHKHYITSFNIIGHNKNTTPFLSFLNNVLLSWLKILKPPKTSAYNIQLLVIVNYNRWRRIRSLKLEKQTFVLQLFLWPQWRISHWCMSQTVP